MRRGMDEKNNFIYLFVSLVSLLFSSFMMDQFPGTSGEKIFFFISIAMFVVGIKSLHIGQTVKRAVYFMAIVASLLASGWFFYPGNMFIAYALLLFELIFFAGAFKTAYRKILFEGEIDNNKIIGSITLYLLLGLIWTVLYVILVLVYPDSFNGIDMQNRQTIYSSLAYFSFVTLTTLGYGDISPANNIARFLVIMEAIAGIFYLALIVSSIVSLRLAEIRNRRNLE
jgi:hypothetical protein